MHKSIFDPATTLKTQNLSCQFEALSHSMDDGSKYAICMGDIVTGVRILTDWKQIVLPGTYIIEHLERGTIIKRIKSYDHKSQTVTCHSLNPDYPEFTLNVNEIKGLHKYENHVRYNAQPD